MSSVVKKRTDPMTGSSSVSSLSSFRNRVLSVCEKKKIKPDPELLESVNEDLKMFTYSLDRIRKEETAIQLLDSLRKTRLLSIVDIRAPRGFQLAASENREKKGKEEKSNAKAVYSVDSQFVGKLARALGDSLALGASIQSLVLEGVRLYPDALRQLCEGIVLSSSLQDLNLRRTYIGDEGALVLCEALEKNESLISLDVSFCALTNKCGESFTKVIRKHMLRRDMKIWEMNLRPGEECSEKRAKIACTGICDIDFSNNFLGDIAMIMLMECLREDRWLRALDLSMNRIGERGCKAIVVLLVNNPTLEYLHIGHNPGSASVFSDPLCTAAGVRNRFGRSDFYVYRGESNRIGELQASLLKESSTVEGDIAAGEDAQISESHFRSLQLRIQEIEEDLRQSEEQRVDIEEELEQTKELCREQAEKLAIIQKEDRDERQREFRSISTSKAAGSRRSKADGKGELSDIENVLESADENVNHSSRAKTGPKKSTGYRSSEYPYRKGSLSSARKSKLTKKSRRKLPEFSGSPESKASAISKNVSHDSSFLNLSLLDEMESAKRIDTLDQALQEIRSLLQIESERARNEMKASSLPSAISDSTVPSAFALTKLASSRTSQEIYDKLHRLWRPDEPHSFTRFRTRSESHDASDN